MRSCEREPRSTSILAVLPPCPAPSSSSSSSSSMRPGRPQLHPARPHLRLDFLSERILSLAFDVISRVLETGPGWRIVSPHFSSLLDSAIFQALVMNERDIVVWEEDADEYIRKNLPSDIVWKVYTTFSV